MRITNSIRNRIVTGGFLLVSLVASYFFYRFLMSDSTLAWRSTHPQSRSSEIEIFALCVLLFLVLRLTKKKWEKIAIVSVFCLFFAHFHSFLLPFVVGSLYFLMFTMTGHLMCCLIAKEKADNLVACIVMGTAGLLTLIAGCSAVGFGTSSNLKIVFGIVFLLEIALCAPKGWSLIQKNCSDQDDSVNFERHWLKDLFLAVILVSFLIQVGRANIAHDFDFLWYGSRADDVLAPYSGIYDRVISTAFVYYYPKGYEALTLPFYCEQTFGFVSSVNLMFTAAVLYVIYKSAVMITNRTTAYFCVMCCAVTAGIMDMAASAKQDMVTLLMQVCMVYFTIQLVKERKGGDLMFVLGAGIVSFAFKTTSMIFSGAFLCFAVVVAIVCRVKLRGRDLIILLVPSVATIAFFVRSYILTGMPFPLFAQDLLKSLGFSNRYPYNSVSVLNDVSVLDVLRPPLFQERFSRLLHFFFWPNTANTDHVVIAWGGLLFSLTWFALVFTVLFHPVRTWKRMKASPLYALSLLALILVSFLSGGSAMAVGQLDGNYFMFWYFMTFFHASVELSYIPDGIRNWYTLTAMPLAVCGMVMCIVSNWAGTLGFTPINVNNPGYYDHQAERVAYYEQRGIDEICENLQNRDEKVRAMTFAFDFPKIQDIPAVADSWTELTTWGNVALVSSPEAMNMYFVEAGIEYLLVEISFLNETPLAKSNLCALAQAGYLSIYMQQEGFYLLLFDQQPHQPDEYLCAILEGKTVVSLGDETYIVEFVSSLSEFTHVAYPDAPAESPSGTGVFFSDANSFTVLSGYSNTINDIQFPEDAVLYLEFSMPHDSSDGAYVTIQLINGDETAEIAAFETYPGQDNSGTTLVQIDNQEPFIGDISIIITSPSGDASADWVTFTNTGIYTESRD